MLNFDIEFIYITQYNVYASVSIRLTFRSRQTYIL